MKLPPEGARWLVSVRWLACALLLLAAWFASSVLGILVNPVPLYIVAGAMVAYNLVFKLSQKDWALNEKSVERNVFWQITADLLALTLSLYFSDISRNPFLLFFVFHMIIASMYLHRWAPYFVAGMATMMVGGVMLLEYVGWIPVFSMRFPSDPPGVRPLDEYYLLGVFVALGSTLWITVYFTTAIHRYVDRAHAELRQKEKMVGIGQLVAGIAHQIANPLDGMQNCLRTIGEGVKGNPRLTEYVQLMAEALERIERTAKRVQSFARPRGFTLRTTDVNGTVENTLQFLGTNHGRNIRIETQLTDVPAVQGDPYTLQEVVFNLCTNALAAMPDGGTITIHTQLMPSTDEDPAGIVAIEVADTGVGIPRTQLEKIFEPFYTTRADDGGTGLGLGLCRMLLSEMDGRIEVRSALGVGSSFTVKLKPTVQPASAKQE